MSSEWEYRGINCIVYEVPIPDNPRYLGYLVFGDEWVEVVDEQGADEPTIFDMVENEVDEMINDLQSDDDQTIDWDRFPDHDDPIPDIDPSPNPEPFPIDPKPNPRPRWDSPTWMSDVDTVSGVPVVTSGLVTVSDTTGGTTTVSLSGLKANDINDDGQYIVDDYRKS